MSGVRRVGKGGFLSEAARADLDVRVRKKVKAGKATASGLRNWVKARM